jgi:hypothetical protein
VQRAGDTGVPPLLIVMSQRCVRPNFLRVGKVEEQGMSKQGD